MFNCFFALVKGSFQDLFDFSRLSKTIELEETKHMVSFVPCIPLQPIGLFV